MSKLSTPCRDARLIKPKLFQEILVWSEVYHEWRHARYDGDGVYTVPFKGMRKAVPKVRFWMPIPKLPE